MGNGQGTADVLSALGNCYFRMGRLEQSAATFLKVPEAAGEAYRTSIAMQGEISAARNDPAGALVHYKRALQLGGSIRFSPAILQDRIDRIEKKQREKASEPTPLTIQVKHLHGKLRGSCSGTLSVTSRGVRYDGKDAFSASLQWTAVVVGKENKFTLQMQGKSLEFEGAPGDGERFQEALDRYHLGMGR